MAVIKSLNQKENSIFSRIEGNALIEFENTISLNDARNLLTKKLAVEDGSSLDILNSEVKHGKHLAEVEFELYSDKKIMDEIKILPKKKRNAIKEEAKKAFEEKKKARLEAEAKAEEEKKAKEEAKPEEAPATEEEKSE